MKLIKAGTKPWLEKEGYSKKFLLGGKGLGKFSHIQELKIKPGEMAEEHFHKKQTEVFYFFNNDGYWIVNGKKICPNIGDVLIIEPLDIHTAISNGLKDYIYLAVKFDYDPRDYYLK